MLASRVKIPAFSFEGGENVEYTSNLNLKKPAGTDTVLISDLNSNMDTIDAAIKKNNFAATTAPGVSDDSAAGYSIGSKWVDVTGDKFYFCVDATAGAAVWSGGSSGGGSSLYLQQNCGGF